MNRDRLTEITGGILVLIIVSVGVGLGGILIFGLIESLIGLL